LTFATHLPRSPHANVKSESILGPRLSIFHIKRAKNGTAGVHGLQGDELLAFMGHRSIANTVVHRGGRQAQPQRV
jgi:hypothetical protein